MNQKTYIISGGTSFIGIELTNYLLVNDYKVISLCRNIAKAQSLLLKHENLQIVCCDMDAIEQLSTLVSHADVFVHLAWAGVGDEGRMDKALQDLNISQSLKAIEAASKIGCSLFVEAGSQAEYGLIKGTLTEDTPCHPDNEYGKAKFELGSKAEVLCGAYGMKFIHLRILSIFGEGDKDWTMIISSVKKMLYNKDVQLSEGTQLWNYVYVKDAVKQIALLCEHALTDDAFTSEIYLIGSKDIRPLKQFIEEIYAIIGSTSKLLYGFYKPMNVVELNPDMTKTETATGGFLSDYSFEDGIKSIIENVNR